mgnify:CR=1 FL=1
MIIYTTKIVVLLVVQQEVYELKKNLLKMYKIYFFKIILSISINNIFLLLSILFHLSISIL